MKEIDIIRTCLSIEDKLSKLDPASPSFKGEVLDSFYALKSIDTNINLSFESVALAPAMSLAVVSGATGGVLATAFKGYLAKVSASILFTYSIFQLYRTIKTGVELFKDIKDLTSKIKEIITSEDDSNLSILYNIIWGNMEFFYDSVFNSEQDLTLGDKIYNIISNVVSRRSNSLVAFNSGNRKFAFPKFTTEEDDILNWFTAEKASKDNETSVIGTYKLKSVDLTKIRKQCEDLTREDKTNIINKILLFTDKAYGVREDIKKLLEEIKDDVDYAKFEMGKRIDVRKVIADFVKEFQPRVLTSNGILFRSDENVKKECEILDNIFTAVTEIIPSMSLFPFVIRNEIVKAINKK